jgi:hypothetical protein
MLYPLSLLHLPGADVGSYRVRADDESNGVGTDDQRANSLAPSFAGRNVVPVEIGIEAARLAAAYAS